MLALLILTLAIAASIYLEVSDTNDGSQNRSTDLRGFRELTVLSNPISQSTHLKHNPLCDIHLASSYQRTDNPLQIANGAPAASIQPNLKYSPFALWKHCPMLLNRLF